MAVEFKAVRIEKPEDVNLIIGQSHFIKTLENLYEACMNTSPHIRFGVAFAEASGACLIRADGNDAELKDVANKEKFMPRDFISEDGFGITAKCRQYLTPLIQGEDYPPYKNGLPQYVRLKNVAAKKKLNEFKL